MKLLVICRPRPGVGRDQIAEHAAAEFAALKRLKAEGQLLEAYSPGGPGAILLLDDEQAIAERLLRSLTLGWERVLSPERRLFGPALVTRREAGYSRRTLRQATAPLLALIHPGHDTSEAKGPHLRDVVSQGCWRAARRPPAR